MGKITAEKPVFPLGMSNYSASFLNQIDYIFLSIHIAFLTVTWTTILREKNSTAEKYLNIPVKLCGYLDANR